MESDCNSMMMIDWC